MEKISRRDFLKRAAVVSAGAVAAVSIPSIVEAASQKQAKGKKIKLKNGSVILFQGDSITDNGRVRKDTGYNSAQGMGFGYATLAGAEILCKHAAKSPKVYNRGISADKVFMLTERWEKDCFDLQPDVVSILIGVNDFWHYNNGDYDYKKYYMDLVSRTKDRLPDVQMVICQPFAIKGVNRVDDTWFPGYNRLMDAAREVADKFDAVFVPFHEAFQEAVKVAPPSYWSRDGIHSTLAGSQLMAATWLDATGL